MEHPPCSLDLTPCDFWLFPVLKKALRRQQFYSNWELLAATETFFNYLPESQFRKTFEDQWPECMQNCILSRGRYFEKDQNKNKDVNNDSK